MRAKIGIDGEPEDLLLQFLIGRDTKLNCGCEPFPYSLKFVSLCDDRSAT